MLTDKDLENIDQVIAKRVKAELQPIKEDVTQIRKDVKNMVNFFDHEYLELRKRLERVEAYLKLPPLS